MLFAETAGAFEDLGGDLGHGVVLFEEGAQLIGLGDAEVDDGRQTIGGEGDGPREARTRRGDEQFTGGFKVQGHHFELPGLPAVDQSQGIGIDVLFAQVDGACESEVLFDPCVFDGFDGDIVHAFRQDAEGQLFVLLRLKDFEDLLLGQDALLDENLADTDGL